MPPLDEPISPDLYFALSQFLYDEAALLDARDWDSWERLFLDRKSTRLNSSH